MDFDLYDQLVPVDDGLVLWDLVEEHLEVAAFQHEQWERAQDQHALVPATVASRVEPRLRANVDALALSGAVAPTRLVAAARREGDRGEMFAAAAALLGRGSPAARTAALELFSKERGERLDGVRRAFELSDAPDAGHAVVPFLEAAAPPVRAAALAVCAARGIDPGDALGRALADTAPEVRRAALDVVVRRGPGAHRAAIEALYDADDAATRDAALRAGIVAGLGEALGACRAAAQTRPSREAWLLLALAGSAADLEPLLRAALAPRTSADALWALGFSGRVEAADACCAMAQKDDRAVARLAAEAFAGITGADLVPGALALPPPRTDPDVDPPDDALALRPEDELPVPDPAALAAWWSERRGAFDPAVRHVLGRPVADGAMLDALARAPMRRRHALALDLAVQTGGRLFVDTRTWVRAQLAAIHRHR